MDIIYLSEKKKRGDDENMTTEPDNNGMEAATFGELLRRGVPKTALLVNCQDLGNASIFRSLKLLLEKEIPFLVFSFINKIALE